MAASPVLADTSFYIGMLRRGRDALVDLAAAAAARDLAVCGVIRCEVGRRIKSPKVRGRLHSFWDVMINVPTDDLLWLEVERTLWELDRKGTVLPLTDVVIGCAARRIGALVLAYDVHFDLIPGVRATTQLEL